MIDIHCHLLPGIDDGAKDMSEALALINLSVDDGVKRIVVTHTYTLGVLITLYLLFNLLFLHW